MDSGQPTGVDLAKVPLFADLPPDPLDVLAGRFQVEGFDAGRMLITEGRPGYVFYIIASGRVAVQHDGAEVRHLGPGDYLGEIAILGRGRRTATVVAIEPVITWSLFGTEFRVLQSERPDVAAELHNAMTQRLASDANAET